MFLVNKLEPSLIPIGVSDERIEELNSSVDLLCLGSPTGYVGFDDERIEADSSATLLRLGSPAG